MCVPQRWKCDGDKDCPDGADESVKAGCGEYRQGQDMVKVKTFWKLRDKKEHMNLCCTSYHSPNIFMSQCSTIRVAAMSSCARTDSVSPNILCVTMTKTAAMAQMSPQSVVSGPWPLLPDLKSSLFFPVTFNNKPNSLAILCCFSLQNIQPVVPMSSAVPMDAASSRVHGSVTETLTAMTSQTKHPRTYAAPALVKLTQPLQKHFTFHFILKYVLI